MTQQAKAETPKGDGKPTPLAAASPRWCGITARIWTLVVRPERALTCVG